MRIHDSLLLAGLLAATHPAAAANVAIQNNSFENSSGTVATPTTLGLTIRGTNSGNLAGWTAVAGTSVAGLGASSITTGNSGAIGCPTPPAGTNAAALTLATAAGSSLILSQDLGAAYLPNSQYVLTFELDPGLNLSLLGQSTMELEAAASLVASISDATLAAEFTAGNTFQTISLNYTTGSVAPTGDIVVAFQQNSLLGLGGTTYLDNAQLTMTPVPEPPAVFVLGLGLTLLCVIQRARSKMA